MSWCPKCKNEYRAGIKVCPDCNEPLVEELSEAAPGNYIPLFQTTDAALKDKVVRYLIYCHFDAKEIQIPQASEPTWAVLVPEDDAKKAISEVQAALSYEAKELAKDESSDEEQKERPRSNIPASELHINGKERYQEYKSSGIMLITFSVLIILFAVLNVLHIITFMSSLPSLIVLFAIAAVFLYLGITSLQSTGKILKEAQEEEKTTEIILAYLKEHFTKEILDAMHEDGLSEELLYFKQVGAMKEAMNEHFPEEDGNYIDALLEDYYNSLSM